MQILTDKTVFLACFCALFDVICCFGSHWGRAVSHNDWGSCPEHCRCMPLNHRGVREILDSLDSIPELGSKAEIESRNDGRTMICQGIRRLPNPVPYGK